VFILDNQFPALLISLDTYHQRESDPHWRRGLQRRSAPRL